jgi:hypothetical protein
MRRQDDQQPAAMILSVTRFPAMYRGRCSAVFKQAQIRWGRSPFFRFSISPFDIDCAHAGIYDSQQAGTEPTGGKRRAPPEVQLVSTSAGILFIGTSEYVMVRKYFRTLLLVAFILAVAAGVAGYSIYQAAQLEPAFYRSAMQAPTQQQAEAGFELEQNLLELRNDARTPGHWEAVFTDEQINGWLAVDFPEKFPGTLPHGVENPRVEIRDGAVNIAARYEDKLVKSVVSIVLDVGLTDEANTLAVTIKRIRAGSLPVPVRQFLDRISRSAQRNAIPLKWSQTDGDPVALVTIPSHHEDYIHREIVVETIELRDGEVYLAGRTDEVPEPASSTVAQRSLPVAPSENATFHR